MYMNITYATTNYELTGEIEAYAEEKAGSISKLITNPDAELRVELEKDAKHHSGSIYRADMTVHSAGLKTHAVGHGATMHAALDLSKDELKRRLTREKGRFSSMSRTIGARVKQMMRRG